jgi:putative heme-binding domain-containing protein
MTAMAILLCSLLAPAFSRAETPEEATQRLFARDNLIAWCIVPFDSKHRTPEQRAEMLQRLGFKHFAYDWRGEHIPTFDAEVDALKAHGVGLDAFWVAPGELNNESKIILDLLKRHGVKAQLWALLDFGADKVTGEEQARRVDAAVAKLKPLADAAKEIGCTVALYNHGGWFGEPENQIAIIEKLKGQGVTNVGMVYNLHHGHEHLDRFAELLDKMKPYLMALNLNGMFPDGERIGQKIVPLGQGPLDLGLLRIIRDSGYDGPIGILGHTQDDAEERLKDNLDGLDWLVPQLDGKPAGPRPTPRTYVRPKDASATLLDGSELLTAALLADARALGDAKRGADVFTDAKFACINCHKVGTVGGDVGPELTTVGKCVKPEEIVESVLQPAKLVKEGYKATSIATTDGRVIQGYVLHETAKEIALKDVATGQTVTLPIGNVDDRRETGTLMPEGLAAAMTGEQRRDLVRFLLDLGRSDDPSIAMRVQHGHVPATFPYDRTPLVMEDWPNFSKPVNRDRLYDYYQKEAEYFRERGDAPHLLPAFPGLDGGPFGHWGNQNEEVWKDDRWNKTDHGSLLSGVFHGPDGTTVPKAVCVRLGDDQKLAACFNPETLTYDALWSGPYLKFTSTRHGFMDGLVPAGTMLPRPEGTKPSEPFSYHGFYRSGKRVVFSYRIGDTEYLDSPWVENGKFTRSVAKADEPSLASLAAGAAPQWPQVFETRGSLGTGSPYALDTIGLPTDNPWKALFFFGGHDFLPDGSAVLCTMQGDVWKVEGLDAKLDRVRWRRIASGLHQALGLVVADGMIHVLGRDQITRLHDRNGDGEIDFYECVNNAYITSAGGHDFICGLERDKDGNFYAASSKQGVIQIKPDGKTVTTLATGFRNPDGIALTPDGAITVPSSEGEWTPASMISEIRPGGHYGYLGPKDGKVPDLPLVYLPRGLDNSSGGQTYIDSERWGPLDGQMLHFSFGAGVYFLVLREKVDGQSQGAVVTLPGDFDSGVHRGRYNPVDGQLYVSGMAGWGTYTLADGCFQRVRYTGDPVQLPVAYHVHENGVLLTFTRPVDRKIAEDVTRQFAQCWNYRYGAAYGSPEFSQRHSGTVGHDPVVIRSATVLDDGKSVFLEMPEIQPVNQLHLHLRVDDGRPIDLFGTVHKLAAPFTGIPGYRPTSKTIAAHPILIDLARQTKTVPNPWKTPIAGARTIQIQAGKNLTYATNVLEAKAGEPIKLIFGNPDVVPHNWALVKPGKLAVVGDLAHKLIADPEAVLRHYLPKTDDLIVATDIVEPNGSFSIYFNAPSDPGRYPFLCTFPGHWMVMNGVLIVK